ncbi:MAG: hypothetical protein HN353_12015 [Bdellovibrionales bacterium]|jgi:hypothetical protein|nr:hypothetical protein [Bdellovibrionales bacterium]MBT3526179.1 hypothetical protein [Bdellovibrionales bacterium]MBT7669731.1 hypothetical protein [Bdellovibrionales bacterium]MBT7766440.1 hypothetical protein [Bdellovibrionales bacterium]
MNFIKLKNMTNDVVCVNLDTVLHIEQFEQHSNLYFGKGYSISVKERMEIIMEMAQQG